MFLRTALRLVPGPESLLRTRMRRVPLRQLQVQVRPHLRRIEKIGLRMRLRSVQRPRQTIRRTGQHHRRRRTDRRRRLTRNFRRDHSFCQNDR